MRLLLIEDDDTVAAAIATAMTERGHNVARAADGREGAAMVEGGQYDVLVIDRMLPGADGLGMVLGLRARGDATPVLMLTALGTVADRVAGLRGGADDYLVKPFSMDELEARVEALSRRNATPPAQLVIDNLVLDRLARTVQRGDTRITLMPREFQLLELLMLSSPRWSLARCCLNRCGASASIPAPTWSKAMSAGFAARSTGAATRPHPYGSGRGLCRAGPVNFFARPSSGSRFSTPCCWGSPLVARLR